MTIFELLGIGIVFFGVLLFLWLKPRSLTSERLHNEIRFLWEHGKNKANYRCIHQRSKIELVFELRLIGGVKQLNLQTNPLGLTQNGKSELKGWLDRLISSDPKKIIRMDKRSINLGSSLEDAVEVVNLFVEEFLGWGKEDKFKVDCDPRMFNIRIPNYLKGRI
jgi:hypothetical protein